MNSTGALSANVRGALWMALTAFCFAAMFASVRVLSENFDAFEILFFRTLVGLALIAPFVLRGGVGPLKTKRVAMHLGRALFTYVGIMASIYAVAHAPLTEVTAIMFLTPIFAMLAAAAILREVVGVTRWLATVAGFAGALVIIRPGFSEVNLATLAMVVSSMGFAGEWISVKSLTRTEDARRVVFYIHALLLPLSAAPAFFQWTQPAWSDAPALFSVGFFTVAAVYCQARTFAAAEASAVIPFDFLRLPFAALLAYMLFGEVAEAWIWIGAAIIFASGWYVLHRQTPTPPN